MAYSLPGEVDFHNSPKNGNLRRMPIFLKTVESPYPRGPIKSCVVPLLCQRGKEVVYDPATGEQASCGCLFFVICIENSDSHHAAVSAATGYMS